jgi:hypothetical protein
MKMRLLTTLIITFWSFSVNAQLDFNPAELGRQAVESSLGKSQDTLYNQAMENIKNSYTKEKVFTKDPEWYTPDNGLYGGTGMRSDYRGSSEEKIYNLSEKSDTIDSSINVLDNNSEYQTDYINSKKATFFEKLIKIIAVVIVWFLLGFLINFFFYAGKPDYMLGKSKTAKNLHILTNICTIFSILYFIFK